MIHYLKGNILESKAYALVNTVNLVGVMGKGVALQFKRQFPANFKLYQKACKNGDINIGKLLVTKESTVFGEKMIINFPTKTDWRKSSEYSYIESGLKDLISIIHLYSIKSIAVPPLGAGNGGLNWIKVKSMIAASLADINADIYVYEPNSEIVEHLKAERVKLTKARALLLYMLFDLVRNGEYVSEFSCEKICYFLQRFGGQELFKLKYEPKYYGPYSGKVRYVLNALNGSYIMGYSDMNKKPFECLFLIPDSYDNIKDVVKNDSQLSDIFEKTHRFLTGYYSDFGLELLSSVDYIISQCGDISVDQIYEELSQWSRRKGQIFSNKQHIYKAKEHIMSYLYNNIDHH